MDNNWEQLLRTTTVAKLPPFYWTIGNYGRKAAAFLNWATGINKWVTFLASGIIYGREEVVAILKWCNWHKKIMGLF